MSLIGLQRARCSLKKWRRAPSRYILLINGIKYKSRFFHRLMKERTEMAERYISIEKPSIKKIYI
jgi:hypothetical protein